MGRSDGGIDLEKQLNIDEQIEKAEQSAKKLRSKIKKNRKGKDDTNLGAVTKDLAKLPKFGKKCRRTLRGHLTKVYSVHWSGQSDNSLASVSQDGRLLVWNPLTTLKLHAFQISCSWTMTCAFAPSGNFVASGGLDNTCTIYSLTSGSQKPVKELQGHDGYVSCCRFVDDTKIITTSGDSECVLWDIENGKKITTYSAHSGDVMSVDIAPDNASFATGGCDDHVLIWDMNSGELTQFFEGHEDDINVVRYFPSGTAVCSGGDDFTCRLFDIRAGAELMQYKENNQVTSMAFSKSGRLMFASYDDPICRVWDTLKGDKVGQLKGHSDQISSLGLSPDGLALCSGSWDTYVKVYA